MPWHLSQQGNRWCVIKDSDDSVEKCHKTKAMAQAHMAALYANTPDAKGFSMVETGDREIRVLGLEGLEIRHSGRPNEGFTLRGYVAVHNQTSHDLGGFREQIAPGAFDEVLATNPDVHLTWDHDTRYVAARTKNNTLHLESDTTGLFIDAQVGNYSWAKDLRTALERGDINQGSFAFTVAEDGDEFAADEDGNVMRTIRNVGNLYDVTVTAQGAYPQTSLAAVRSLAKATGRPPEEMEAALVAEPEGAEGESESHGGSVEDDEEFARWHAAMETKMAARKATLAKEQERLDKLT
jgi:HK97 family phage prohead protease